MALPSNFAVRRPRGPFATYAPRDDVQGQFQQQVANAVDQQDSQQSGVQQQKDQIDRGLGLEQRSLAKAQAAQQKQQAKDSVNFEKDARLQQYNAEGRPTYRDAEGMVQPKQSDEEWAKVKEGKAAAEQTQKDIATAKLGAAATTSAISDVDQQFTLKGRTLRAAAAASTRGIADAKEQFGKRAPEVKAAKESARQAHDAADEATANELEWERNKLANRSKVASEYTRIKGASASVPDLKKGNLSAKTNLMDAPDPVIPPDKPGTEDTSNERTILPAQSPELLTTAAATKPVAMRPEERSRVMQSGVAPLQPSDFGSVDSATPQRSTTQAPQPAPAPLRAPPPTVPTPAPAPAQAPADDLNAKVQDFNARAQAHQAQQEAISAPVDKIIADITAQTGSHPIIQQPDGSQTIDPSLDPETAQKLNRAIIEANSKAEELKGPANALQQEQQQLQAQGQARQQQEDARIQAERAKLPAPIRDKLNTNDETFKAALAHVNELYPEGTPERAAAIKSIQDEHEQEHNNLAAKAGEQKQAASKEFLDLETQYQKGLAKLQSDDSKGREDLEVLRDIDASDASALGKKYGLTPEEATAAREDARKLGQAWPDFINKAAEKTRELSDGRMIVNPALWTRPDDYTAAVEQSGASDEAKKAALDALPELRRKASEQMYDALSANSTLKDFLDKQPGDKTEKVAALIAEQNRNPNWEKIKAGFGSGVHGIEASAAGLLAMATGQVDRATKALGSKVMSGTADYFEKAAQDWQKVTQADATLGGLSKANIAGKAVAGLAQFAPDAAAMYLTGGLAESADWALKLSKAAKTGAEALEGLEGATTSMRAAALSGSAGQDVRAIMNLAASRGVQASEIESIIRGAATPAEALKGLEAAAMKAPQAANLATDLSEQARRELGAAYFSGKGLGNTYTDAVTSYEKEYGDDDAGKAKARASAIIPSLTNAALTAAIFSSGGGKGLTGMFQSKASTKSLLEYSIKDVAKDVGIHTLTGATQMALDSLAGDIVAKASYDPKRSPVEILQKAWESALTGAAFGGFMRLFHHAAARAAGSDETKPATGGAAPESAPEGPKGGGGLPSPADTAIDKAKAAASDSELQSSQEPEAARATVLRDIAQGKPIDDLANHELAAVGLQRNEKGEVKPVKGKDVVPAVSVENGQPIILQPAIDAVRQQFPATGQLIGMDEVEARQKLTSPEPPDAPPGEQSPGPRIAPDEAEPGTVLDEPQKPGGEVTKPATPTEATAPIVPRGTNQPPKKTTAVSPPESSQPTLPLKQQIMQAGKPLVLAAEKENPKKAAGLAGFVKLLSEAVESRGKVFTGVQFVTMKQGDAGIKFDPDSGALQIDIGRLQAHVGKVGMSSRDKMAAFIDRLMRHEAHHRGFVELYGTPEGKKMVDEMWAQLPDALKKQSADAYFAARGGGAFADEFTAKAEFLAHYGDTPEFAAEVERSMAEAGMLGKFKKLLEAFLKSLAKLRSDPKFRALAKQIEDIQKGIKAALDRIGGVEEKETKAATEKETEKPQATKVEKVAADKKPPKTAEKPALSKEGPTVDQAAHEAATSPKNELPEPTKPQQDAGNYQKGHISIGGLDISIENPAGSQRRPEWPALKSHYGYIRGTEGKDGDHVDVFIRPGTPTTYRGPVFVVNQTKKDGSFDEHKVIIGVKSRGEAERAYLENYTPGSTQFGSIEALSWDGFKNWIATGDHTQPLTAGSRKPNTKADQFENAAAKVKNPELAASLKAKADAVRTGSPAEKKASPERKPRIAKPRQLSPREAVMRSRAFKEQTKDDAISQLQEHGKFQPPKIASERNFKGQITGQRLAETGGEWDFWRKWLDGNDSESKARRKAFGDLIFSEGSKTTLGKADAAMRESLKGKSLGEALEDAFAAREALAHRLLAESGQPDASEKEGEQRLDFEKATESGKIGVDSWGLEVGDTLDVEGEQVKVIGFDRDTGDAILEDGSRFGRQTLATGEVIYVENVKRAGATVEPPESSPEPLTLEQQTPAQVDSEREKAKRAEDLKRKQQAPLKGSMKAGDTVPDMFDNTAGETPLFSQPAAKPVSQKAKVSDSTKAAFDKLRALLDGGKRLSAPPAGPKGNAEFIAAASELAAAVIDDGHATPEMFAKVMRDQLGEMADAKLIGRVWALSDAFDPSAPLNWHAVLDSLAKKGETRPDDLSPGSDVESDRADAGTRNASGQGSIQSEPGTALENGERVDADGTQGGNAGRGESVPADVPAALGGATGDQLLGEREPADAERLAGDSEPRGGGNPDADGVAVIGRGEKEPDIGLVLPAESSAVASGGNSGGEADIRRSAPSLNDGQVGDVIFAEKRLLDQGKPGVLFTNGTGTGKTFTGLGIVKRMLDAGAKDILVVAPSDKVVNDWIATAKKFFGLQDVAQLGDIQSNGAGNRVAVTTYANFGQNNSLVHRPWRAVITDESHYLGQNAEGDRTLALETLRALTLHQNGKLRRASMEDPEAAAMIRRYNAIGRKMSSDQRDELKRWQKQFDVALDRAESKIKATTEADRPKVVMLSATPFAHHFSLDYAEGYLFEHGPEPESRGYNTPSARSKFYMDNFGYRMRTGKLAKPENAVSLGILERMFSQKLMRSGAMSGRALSVPFDYGRHFVITESALGNRLDQIMSVIQSTPRLRTLTKYIGLGDYLARRYLLEALKAREAVGRIREHLALGRKVIVFHDYKKGGATNPLSRENIPEGAEQSYHEGNKTHTVKVREVYDELVDAVDGFDDVLRDLSGLQSPLVLLQREFPKAVVFNGDVPKGQRRAAVNSFNKSGSGADVIVAQRASAKEGISMHDTDGAHQRVLVDLGIPSKPTDAIQCEGRPYRIGVQSNAPFEYLTTGTNFERWTYAQTIAQRASTAENLAMGESARTLLQSFATGYNDAEPMRPSRSQGTGGKAMDAAAAKADPFETAVALYYTNEKKTSRSKSREGIDYFPTPEPLAFKMVEWGGIRPGEKVLEPSAGHGAIARFFPDATNRHAVEPSNELAGRLALNATDTQIHETRFEDYHIGNKFDVVVMNPPFGTAGKTAMEHLIKATKHLRNGGRVVALIPEGSSMEARFEKWMDSDDAKGIYLAAEYGLPQVAFTRAGTSVKARVVILDRHDNVEDAQRVQSRGRRNFEAEDIKEFFAKIKDATAPERVAPKHEMASDVAADEQGETVQETEGTPTPLPSIANPNTFAPADGWHAKNNRPTFVAKVARRLDATEYAQAKATATKHGGYYSAFKGAGAIPGFQFGTAEKRDAFLSEYLPPKGRSLSTAPPADSDEAVTTRLQAKEDELSEELTPEEQAALDEFHAMFPEDFAEFIKPPVTPADGMQPEPEPQRTSIKNAVVDEERKARGLPPMAQPIIRRWGPLGQKAKETLEQNPDAARALVKSLLKEPRAIEDHENALLLLYKVQLHHDSRKASETVNSTPVDSEENKQAKELYDLIQERMNDLDTAGKFAGTKLGQGLNARKMMRDEDYSAEGMRQKYRTEVNLGKPLTEDETREVNHHARDIELAMAELDRIEAELEKKDAEKALQKLTTDLTEESKKPATARKPNPLKKLLNDRAKDARARLAASLASSLSTAPSDTLNAPPAGLSAANLADLALVGAAYIEDGATVLESFAKVLTKEFGEKIKPHADEIFKAAKQAHAQIKAEAEASQTPAGIVKQAKADMGEDADGGISQSLLIDLAKAHIRRGVSTAEELTTKIAQDIQDIYPGATESEVRTVLSGYGKTSEPSKDEVVRRLSELKGHMRLIESAEDALKGKAPLKSGFQRGPQTQRTRELSKELRDVMRRMGIKTTGEDQLADARKAVVNRLRNQIEDLNAIIAGKAKPHDAKQTIEYDAEMNALLKERNELKDYVDDLTGPSPELKWNRKAQQAAKASEEYYKRRIAANDLATKKPATQPENEETKRARAEAAKAKEEFNALREASGIPQAEQLARTRAKIEAEIEKARHRLITGGKPPAGAKKATPSELVEIKQTLNRLRQAIQQVEGKRDKTDTERAQMAAKGLQRSIAELEARIASKNTKPKDRQAPIETPELKELRQTRDFLREVYASVKEAEHPRRLPEEIALDNFRKKVDKEKRELEFGLAKKKYLEAPKPDPIWQARRDAAAYALAKAKKEWMTELFNRKLEARPTIQKIIGTGAEVLNTTRAILTSFDLSAVLRQGGFIAVGNPLRALKSFFPMLKAFYSEKNELTAMEEIRHRPNYALYQQSKLHLTDMDELNLSKMEEQFMSRWAEGLHGWRGALALGAVGGAAGSFAGGVGALPGAILGAAAGAAGLVPGSQRAFVTFLNKLRADSFDAMVATLGRDGRVTIDEGKALANYINVATGRGVIGLSEKAKVGGATIFFAPRLAASRFNLLGGQPLYGGNARTRSLVAKEYVKFMIGAAVTLALAFLMKKDDDKTPFIDFDPRSADFLKARFGNSRLDIFAGLLQPAVFLSRMLSGETKKGDEIRPIRDTLRPVEELRKHRSALPSWMQSRTSDPVGDMKFNDRGAGTVIGQFVRSKLSPPIGAAVDIATGKDYTGNPVTPKSVATNMAFPLSVGDAVSVMKEQDVPRGAILSLMGILGAGMQTYAPYRDDDGLPLKRDYTFKTEDGQKNDLPATAKQEYDAEATKEEEYTRRDVRQIKATEPPKEAAKDAENAVKSMETRLTKLRNEIGQQASKPKTSYAVPPVRFVPKRQPWDQAVKSWTK